MEKTYYELELMASSPLRICGGNEDTDSDILLNGKGLPFIPGSSLAGVLRSCFEVEDQKDIFGDLIIATESTRAEALPSKVLVGDAVLPQEFDTNNLLISRRDGVGLDEWGMSIKGAKYDFQIAEVKGSFKSVIECNFDSQDQADRFENVIACKVAKGICIGARTSRGYGRFNCKAKKKVFKFPENINEWLEFDVYADGAFDEMTTSIQPQSNDLEETTIMLKLNLIGNLSIREKEANAVVREDGTNPDDVTIKNIEGVPVIPGTSWAGSFRHHMLELNKYIDDEAMTDDMINRLFGKGISPSDSTKSILVFSESVVEGGEPVITMRNAVDRFTSAPTNGNLFCNESWNGGSTKLYITYNKNKLTKNERQLLSICIMDLHQGLMSIGGGAGVGKGLMTIEQVIIDDKDKTNELENYSLSI